MKYICHRRYKKKGASGKDYNFSRGTELNTISNFIALNTEAICTTTSEDAYMYFSRNDDNNGLERGDLTYSIAYSNRKPNKENSYRFTPSEINLLESEYYHFLRHDVDTIIFNKEFFNADINELRKLHNRLEVNNNVCNNC